MLKNTTKKRVNSRRISALKSGVSRQTIISIERYRYKPSLELGLKMALSFRVRYQQIIFPRRLKRGISVLNLQPIKETSNLQ